MTPLILVAVLSLGAARADTCTDLSEQRLSSARALLDESLDTANTAAIDRSSIVERARILLERTADEDPSCKAAKSMHKQATRMLKEAEPISRAASADDALMHALERVEALEQAASPDREEIETVRFMLAELGSHFPDDERVDALVRRVLAVQRGEK
ncbi:MAG: hypothetical protein ABIO70_09375 [Pseudomonadota bacterium]